MPVTISLYIARQFLYYFSVVFIAVIFLILMFDVIELTRISASKTIPFLQVLKMSTQRTFGHLNKVVVFIVFLSSILTYTRFAKTSETIIFKTGGLSVWQFLLPSMIVGLIIGVLFTTAINPITAYMLTSYQKSEAVLLQGKTSLLSLSKTGLWMMQSDNNKNRSIIHALRMYQNTHELYEVTFYFLNEHDNFIKRVDANVAKLENEKWIMKEAYLTTEHDLNHKYENYEIPTTLSFNQIQESLVLPETLSFWKLPGFISVAESSGLSGVKHKLYYAKLLIMPFLFSAMIMLGGAFSLSIPRLGKASYMLFSVLILGFLLYFISDIIFALGVAGSIPVWLSAVSPFFLTFLLAVYFIMHFEEGRG